MKTSSKIAIAAAAIGAYLIAKKKGVISGIGHTSGARIVDNVELMSNCDSVEEIEERLKEHIERYKGHVVNDITEAHKWFKQLYGNDLDFDDVHYGESQYSHFSLDKEDRYGYVPTVRVIIDEIYVDSGSFDYCYMVRVEED